ncbi:hypothetical protein BT93_E1977 [Corymbia citriodora subsp. variegata]|nr:hypothetical protein BT93_E1977 [Corymbia citriodora subsp. variegata]
MFSFNVSQLLSFTPSLTSIVLVLFLGGYPHRSLHALSRRYGPLMMLHFGSAPVLVVSSADSARDIMKTHDLIFSDRARSTLSERLLYHRKDVSLAPYGEYWRQMRSICVLHLLSNKKISLFMDKIEQHHTVDLSDGFASLTNNIICRLALGRKYSDGKQGKKFKGLLADLMWLIGIFNIGDFIPSLAWINKLTGVDAKAELVTREFDQFLNEVVEEHRRKMEEKSISGDAKAELVTREFDQFLNEVVEEHRRKMEEKSISGGENSRDFVDVLLEMEKDKTVGFALGADSIKALILLSSLFSPTNHSTHSRFFLFRQCCLPDMLAGATDTIYTVMDWAMTELLRHPQAMNILQTEVRKIANGKPNITDEDLKNMHYLRAVLKETLRLHPPIPLLVPRLSSQDIKIRGYDIALGTTVITNVWTIGRDPSTWDEPDEFKPERFLNSSVDFKGQDFELIPFGAGRRGCPGTSLAMASNELVLANLVDKFDWALPEGLKAEDLDMTECTGLTIHRKVHLLATFPS